MSGAAVTLRDAVSEESVGQGVTDARGEWVVRQLPEGFYQIEVKADQHRGYRDIGLVTAGFETNVVTFLPREAVRYIWTVVPTEIEDRTRITIETVFEAFVPMPVVTVDPALLDLSEYTADVTQVELRITNHGLVAAQKARLNFGTHPDWSFQPLIEALGDLPARSTLTVPLLIRRTRNNPGGLAALAGPALHSGGGGCSVGANLNWQLLCGDNNVGGNAPIAIVNAGGSGCGGGGGGSWGGGASGGSGGGGGGGGGGSSGSSASIRSCDPCLLAILNCLVDLVIPDALDCLKDLYGCASHPPEDLSAGAAWDCTKAGLTCAEALGAELSGLNKAIDAVECVIGLAQSCGPTAGGGADIVRFLGEGDSGGVCAHVRLRLEQELVSTRDAFTAALIIENALPDPLEQVAVEVLIRRRNGDDASTLFAVHPPQLSGLSAVDGTGTLAGGATGKGNWLLIPTTEAATAGPEEFLISGRLRYRQVGLQLNVPLAPAAITVFPSPALAGKYFHQRNVFADDPFTHWQRESFDRNAVYQGALGKTYAFYSVATDAAGNRESEPPAPDARTRVTRVNRSPVLDPIPDQVLREGETLEVQPLARDPDGDALVFSLNTNRPPGIVIHPFTGRITWVTGPASGPATHRLTVEVLDHGAPRLGASRTVTVTVADSNSAPALDPLPDRTVPEGRLLVTTNRAFDADLPRQNLRFSLGPGAPVGAVLDPVSGVFAWEPTPFQGGLTYRVEIRVTDDGTPPLSTSRTFNITVRDTRSDFRLSLGSTHVVAGHFGSVPLILDSGADLLRLEFELESDDSHLADLDLAPATGEIAAVALQPPGRKPLPRPPRIRSGPAPQRRTNHWTSALLDRPCRSFLHRPPGGGRGGGVSPRRRGPAQRRRSGRARLRNRGRTPARCLTPHPAPAPPDRLRLSPNGLPTPDHPQPRGNPALDRCPGRGPDRERRGPGPAPGDRQRSLLPAALIRAGAPSPTRPGPRSQAAATPPPPLSARPALLKECD